MTSIPTTIDLPALSDNVSRSIPVTTYHLFFVTGNPGLIAYYSFFLHKLHKELNASWALKQHNANVAVYGRSLSGFEIDDDNGNKNNNSTGHHKPLSLQQQIDFVENILKNYITLLSTPSAGQAKQKHKIILLGHSVGAYILLTLLSSHLATSSSTTITAIEAGICLFPTVVDIGASPAGVKLGWLSRWVPGLPGLAARLVGLLHRLLGATVFAKVVGVVTGMEEASKRVTVKFLESRGGVRQALHMAHDELLTITTDKWDSRIWGAATEPTSPSVTQQIQKQTPPKLFFYFGRNDHWVAERTRDDLMALRGRRSQGNMEEGGRGGGEGDANDESWKPWMEIDEHGVPHGFCLTKGHSTAVAMKCREFIESVVTGSSV